MSRFLLGDDLGNIKTLRYCPETKDDIKTVVKTAHTHDTSSGPASVQQLASSSQENGSVTLSAAFSNGSCLLSTINENDSLEVLSEWKEPRIVGNKFIGMALTESSVITCTSNGMLRKSVFVHGEEKISNFHSSTLPSRLFDWRLSEDAKTFAYGGDEVDLSVWNTELAFQERPATSKASSSSTKRKRNDNLIPGEIWRARNIPNDYLNLRQPIRITALSYISTSPTSNNIVTGTQFGDLRCYDTRAGRRPISNWTGVAKVGGVKVIQKGLSDHELFIADGGSSLYSMDLRTGKILYGYKGLSGAVTAIAPCPAVMASTALDRYARVHSVISPPHIAAAHQEHKGVVLDKSYLTSVPTSIVWDRCKITSSSEQPLRGDDDNDDDDDDVWDKMENIT